MRTMPKRRYVWIFLLAVVSLLPLLLTSQSQAAPRTIHFQGKLTNPDGTNVVDGTYSILFTIYDGGTDTGGGTNVWSETQSATLTAGLFDVYLGSVNQTLGTAVDFTHNPLYLSIKVGSDPEMTPFILFGSSPHAFNSDALNGLSSSNFVQLAQGVQTDASNVTASITINKTGSAGIIDLQNTGSTVFSINANGNVQSGSPSGSNIVFSTDTSTNRLQVGDGLAASSADSTLFVLDSAASATAPIGVNGGMYYDTDLHKFRCFENGTWKDCAEGAAQMIGQFYDNTGGTDMNNSTPTAIPWDSETRKDNGITHDNATNNTRVYLDSPGWYQISYNVNGTNQSTNRNTTYCRLRFNGTTYNTPSGSYAYTRNTTDASGTNTSSIFVQTTGTNEYYEVVCTRAGSAGAQLTNPGESWTAVQEVNANNGSTLQATYDNGSTISTTDGRDVLVTLNDTTTDPNFIINMTCSVGCGGNGRFAVQSNGIDVLTVNPDTTITVSGDISSTGTYNTNTFTSSSLIFGAASTASIQSSASQALNITGNAASMVSTTSGALTLQSGTGTVSLGTSTGLTAAGSLSITSGGSAALTLDSGATGDVNLGTGANSKAVSIGNTSSGTTVASYVGAGTNAYSIQGNGGSIYLQLDTTENRLYVGDPTADSTAVVLVFDTKNTVGDPVAAVNGSEYYNSATGSLRCYEDGFWSDCSTTRYLGGATLASSATEISVTLAKSVTSLECRLEVPSKSSTAYYLMRFNGDTTSNYGWNVNGIVTTATTDWQDANDTEIQLSGTQTSTAATQFLADIHIYDYAGANSIVDWSASGLLAKGTNSHHYDGVGGWYSTSQITSVQFDVSTGTFDAGSSAWCSGR